MECKQLLESGRYAIFVMESGRRTRIVPGRSRKQTVLHSTAIATDQGCMPLGRLQGGRRVLR